METEANYKLLSGEMKKQDLTKLKRNYRITIQNKVYRREGKKKE